MEFEWDAAKEISNLKKHSVSFSEAVETFHDPNGFQIEDTKHSESEDRFYWVGKASSGNVLTTRFTKRGTKIRIIGSAEWRKLRKLYDERTQSK
jgi:hypothetical protein